MSMICNSLQFALRIGLWNQYNICICNVFPNSSEKFMLTFNTGEIFLEFETAFQNFEGIFNLWPGFQLHSRTTATSACLWLMSFTWHFQPLIRSQTVGSCGRPPLPLIYIWIEGLSFMALQTGNGQWRVCERGHSYVALPSQVIFFF